MPDSFRDFETCDLVPLRDYQVQHHEKIGEGTFGVVYRSVCTTTRRARAGDSAPVLVERRPCAVKSLKSTSDQKRVRVEVRLLRNLAACPQIVRLLDVVGNERTGEVTDLLFEHCPSEAAETLYPRLRSGDARTLMRQLLTGLEYCHSRGVMHRDVKPANLLVDPATMHLRIIDFGLATVYWPTEEYQLAGSVPYKAPELLLGARHYHHAVDVWAAGRVFLHMLYPPGGELLRAPLPHLPELEELLRCAGGGGEADRKRRTRLEQQQRRRQEVTQLQLLARKTGTRCLRELARKCQLVWPLAPAGSKLPVEPVNWHDFLAPTLACSEGATRRERLRTHFKDPALDLLNRMLEVDPGRRISAADALEHAYFRRSKRGS